MGTLKQEKTEPFTSATHILRNCCNELAWKELYDSGQEDEEDNASGYTAQTPIVSAINEALRVVLKVRNDPHRMGTCMFFPVSGILSFCEGWRSLFPVFCHSRRRGFTGSIVIL